MKSRFRFAPRGRERLLDLDSYLDDAYRAPESVLANQPHALDEAIYIILSFQTNLARFKETWQRLRSAFPRWQHVNCASMDEVAKVLHSGGLHRQKAKAIKRLLSAVHARFGEYSLDALQNMSNDEAERVLTQLPGLSWKGARCVLLYALSRNMFPVDGNTFRILKRTGVIPRTSVYRRKPLHDSIQNAVPPSRRRPFHVNLVLHGQRVCLPHHPLCTICPLINVCPRHGLQELPANHMTPPLDAEIDLRPTRSSTESTESSVTTRSPTE